MTTLQHNYSKKQTTRECTVEFEQLTAVLGWCLAAHGNSSPPAQSTQKQRVACAIQQYNMIRTYTSNYASGAHAQARYTVDSVCV